MRDPGVYLPLANIVLSRLSIDVSLLSLYEDTNYHAYGAEAETMTDSAGRSSVYALLCI